MNQVVPDDGKVTSTNKLAIDEILRGSATTYEVNISFALGLSGVQKKKHLASATSTWNTMTKDLGQVVVGAWVHQALLAAAKATA